MAVVIDATPKGASANSYVLVADADAYFDERLRTTAWTGATTDDKARALIMATQDLDSEVEWNTDRTGWRTTGTQALEFPRQWVLKRGVSVADDPTISASVAYYDDDLVPDWLVAATCEQALSHLTAERTTDPDSRGIRSLTAGAVGLTFDGAASQQRYRMSDAARRLVMWWAENMDPVGAATLKRAELVRA